MANRSINNKTNNGFIYWSDSNLKTRLHCFPDYVSMAFHTICRTQDKTNKQKDLSHGIQSTPLSEPWLPLPHPVLYIDFLHISTLVILNNLQAHVCSCHTTSWLWPSILVLPGPCSTHPSLPSSRISTLVSLSWTYPQIYTNTSLIRRALICISLNCSCICLLICLPGNFLRVKIILLISKTLEMYLIHNR